MDAETLQKLKAVCKNSQCPAGCKCHLIRPEELCKAKRTGLNVLLECLEDNPENCTFAMAFGGSYYCKCGTRMEIAKILGE